MVEVTIIIPNWNGAKWLPGCLDALQAQSFEDFIIIVVDNGSSDASHEIVLTHRLQPQLLSLDQNYGFAYAVNRGIEKCTTPFVALLNNDTKPEIDWLAHLVKSLKEAPDRQYGVGSLMLNMVENRLIDDAGNTLSWYGAAGKINHGKPIVDVKLSEEVFSISAGAALYRHSFFKTVGLFDEHFESYLEDIDLGLRARLQQYICKINPSAITLHQSHGSDLAHDRYIKLVTCNRLLLFCKNIPTSILIRKLPLLLYGQFYFFIAYGRPLASLRGYVRFLKIISQTQKIKPNIAKTEVVSALTNDLPLPPLGHFLKGYWYTVLNKLGLK